MDKRVFAPTRASEWAFSPFGHTLSAQSIFRDVHAAAKNELNSIRGLRAANSARLFDRQRPPRMGRPFDLAKCILPAAGSFSLRQTIFLGIGAEAAGIVRILGLGGPQGLV